MAVPRPTRRALVAACFAVPVLARAAPWLRDQVVVYAEPTLKPVLRAIGARFGVAPVYVFTQPTAQNLALLAHGTQDDLLIGLAALAPRAEAAGLTAPGARPLWRNRLVLAAAGAGPTRDFDAESLAALLGTGRLAVTDATPASSLDGFAVLARLGLPDPVRSRAIGAATSADVALLLRRGEAALGLVHATDLAPGLYAAMRVPDTAYDPIVYTVAQSRKAWSRNTDPFVAFLASDAARGLARDAGLKVLI